MVNSTGKTILLVDDNLFFLKLLEKAFNKSGYECLIAGSSAQAIVILKEKANPDMILSDYEMPEMNGMEFRKYLLGNATFKDIPFVFLTGFSDKGLIVEGLELMAVDYVIKDTPVNVIVSKVNNILFTIEKQRELTKLEIKKAASLLNFRSIPLKAPKIKGFTIDFWHRPYEDVPGGDFIDFIRVDNRYDFIVLGDVMGKKWMAWFFTFGFLSYVRSAIRFAAFSGEYSTAKILDKINNIICFDDVMKDILASLSLLLIDNKTNQISYSGAGDLPLLHYKSKEKQIDSIKSSGLLLGLFEEGDFNQQNIFLEKGDMLFAFTDGMIDFSDVAGKRSNYNLLSEVLLPYLKEDNAFMNMKKNLFSKGLNTQVDDRSIISLHKN
jgi:sigma-B regulation protein RsbU (phosphoserine phosphatase)